MYLGNKYYNDKELIRVIKETVLNVRVKNEITGKEQNISKNQLANQYTKLKPHGKLHIYETHSTYQVIPKTTLVILFYYTTPLEYSDKYNEFVLEYSNNISGIEHFIELNEEKYNKILEERNPIKGSSIDISIYIDDNIRSIYSIIGKELLSRYIKVINMYKISAKELFSDVLNRMDQVCKIHSIRLTGLKQVGNNIVIFSDKSLYDIQKIIGNHISTVFCTNYWYDIDLNKIENSYMLIRDSITKKLYIVKYIKGPLLMEEIKSVFSDDELNKFLR